MNFEYFISLRIAIKAQRTFSKLIVRIAIAGVMLSIAVMLLSMAIIRGFKSEITDKARGFLGDIQITKLNLNNSFENTPFVFNDSLKQLLKSNEALGKSYVFATKPGIIMANEEIEGINFKGIDKNYNNQFLDKYLISGRRINFADSLKANQELLISSYTANRLKLKVDDSILMYFVQDPPRKRKLKVVGIYNTGIEDLDKSFVIGSLPMLQRLNQMRPDEIGGIELSVKDFNKLDATAMDVFEELPLNLKSKSLRENFPNIFIWLDMLDVNTQVLLVLMLVVGVINMISALLIMILERTQMIGLLKALGSTDWSVMKIFLYNAMFLVGLGLLLGNILGLGLGFLQYYTQVFTLNPSNYFLAYVPIEFRFWDIVLINVMTLFVCFLVLLLPAMLVSKITPLKAIRFK